MYQQFVGDFSNKKAKIAGKTFSLFVMKTIENSLKITNHIALAL